MSEKTVYRRKNDSYYITLLLYVAFAVLYVAITAKMSENTVAFGTNDPVLYIILGFILYALIRLLMNVFRRPCIVIDDNEVVFQTKFGKRRIRINEIKTLLLKREAEPGSEHVNTIVKIRVSTRKRWYRVRISNFEKEDELYTEFKNIRHKIYST